MALNPNADFNQLSTWLNQNLTENNSIIPHINTIPRIPSKGIYFWFMHPDGYKALSKFEVIEPITTRYTKEIGGVKYDLVYLGTTGTGKQGNSNLFERLNWHINQKHRESTICQKESALSTLRTGLGALLSNDLIIPDTVDQVNTFMKIYMKVFWIKYTNDMQLIDNDEKILIIGIRPLLNLKNNPNSWKKAKDNPTKLYKVRRNDIEYKTKSRLGFDENKPKKQKTKSTSKQKTLILKDYSIKENNGCVEFKVLQNQSAFDLIKNYEFKANKYTIDIFETKKTNNYICSYYDKTSIPNKYFGNTDTNRSRLIDNREPARWKVIQKTMIQNNIQEITIRLRPLI